MSEYEYICIINISLLSKGKMNKNCKKREKRAGSKPRVKTNTEDEEKEEEKKAIFVELTGLYLPTREIGRGIYHLNLIFSYIFNLVSIISIISNCSIFVLEIIIQLRFIRSCLQSQQHN